MALHQLLRGRGKMGNSILSPATLVQMADVTLTNAQMLALRATPIQLVAAPGANKFLEFVTLLAKFTSAGAYTVGANNLAVKQTNGSGVAVSGTLTSAGIWDAATGTKYGMAQFAVASNVVLNAALVIHNTGAGEFTGGNAGNVTKFRVFYRVHDLASL